MIIRYNTEKTFLNISKLFFLIYIIYTNVSSWSLFYIPRLSIILLSFAILSFFIFQQFIIRLDYSLVAYMLFALYSLGSGMLFAVNKNTLFQSCLTFFEYLLTLYLILGYSHYDKNVNFAMKSFVAQAIIAGALVLFSGVTVENRETFSEEVNVNTVGVMVVLAIAYMLFMFIPTKKTLINSVAVVVITLFLSFVVLQTVSKKAIISGAAIILLWLLCCYKTSFSKIPFWGRVITLLILGYIIYIAIRWYQKDYSDSFDFLLYRMSLITTGDSSAERKGLISEGLRVFLEHPTFGVGLNNFRYYNQIRETYSHCFYTEILACTGIIGTAMFVIPFIPATHNILQSIKSLDENTSNQSIYLLCMLSVFIFICFTQIIFYEYNLMYFLSIFIAYSICVKNKMIKDF